MKSLKLSIIAATAILFTACSNTPEDAVYDIHDSLKNGYVVKIANNTGEKASVGLMVEALKNCTVDKKSYSDDIKLTGDCMIEKYKDSVIENIKIKKIDDTTVLADVKLKGNSLKSNFTFYIKKFNYKWKVMELR